MSTTVTPTLLDRFEKYAPNKSVAKRIYNLVLGIDFCDLTLSQLLSINGMGRSAAIVVMQVACDLNGKK